jgi:hypothetical protein
VLLAELHQSDWCTTPVRPVQVWADRRLGFVQVVVVLVVGMESLQVVSLLGVLPLMLNTGWEES